MALASALIAASIQTAPAEPAEIVVTATAPRKCKVELADRALSNRQLEASARGWAALGIPVRVVHPRGAHYRCLAKIAFALEKHGVRLIHFVERTR